MSSPPLSIQQAMELMHLQPASEASPTIPNPRTRKTKSSKRKTSKHANAHRIVLPLPKRVGISKERRIFYGFDVSNEWLAEYCERNTHRIQDYDPDSDLIMKMFIAMDLLTVSSKIRNLTIEGVICRVNEPELGGTKGCGPLVCVCSSMKSSYERRPTDAQLNKLRSIIGKEPDWFVDINPPSYYS